MVIEGAADEYGVPSPSLLGLLEDAIANGVSVDGALTVAAAIAAGVRVIASAVAQTLGEELGDRTGDEAVVALLRRGRVLVAQATSRLLLHELGLALAQPANRPADAEMAGLVNRLRIGRAASPPAAAGAARPAAKGSHGE